MKTPPPSTSIAMPEMDPASGGTEMREGLMDAASIARTILATRHPAEKTETPI